jgi:COMPASS component SWD3
MGNGWLLHVVSAYSLIAVAADKTIRLWNAIDGKHIRTFLGHKEGISDIAWSSDSEFICSASDDKSIRIWNVNNVKKADLLPKM